MVVGASRDDPQTALVEGGGETSSVGDDLALIAPELRVQGFPESDRLGRNDVHQRSALHARENRAVDPLGELLRAHDETAAWTTQGLVGRGGHEVTVRHRRGQYASRYQAGDVVSRSTP